MKNRGNKSSVRYARRILALSVLLASSPCAAADLDLFSAESLSLSGNVRLSATSGEQSWVDGGYGKLGTSGNGDGLNWRNVIGMTVVDGKLLAAYSNGNLTSTVVTRGVPVPATRTTFSGPLVDGRNWNGRDLFAYSPA